MKKNHEILTALHYKPLYNIKHSGKWGKKYTSLAYNGVHTVVIFVSVSHVRENLRDLRENFKHKIQSTASPGPTWLHKC